MKDGEFYTMSIDKCDERSIDPHVYHTFNNSLYSPNSTFSNGPCTSFESWQAAGQDSGSHVLELPSQDDIVQAGRTLLGL